MGVDEFLMSRASGAPLRELRSVNKMLVDGCLIGPCCCPFWSFPKVPSKVCVTIYYILQIYIF